MPERTQTHDRRASDAPIAMVPSRAADPALLTLMAERVVQTVFQPQFNFATGKLVGAEALARMPGEANARGLFRRAAAAGVAERLSREIQRDALRLAAAWGAELGGLGLSINVRPDDLSRANYPEWLEREANTARVDLRRITLEITEDAAIEDVDAVSRRLDRLRGLGVRVALDDFGTGFASLSCLARLPLDQIKIDRGLIRGIECDARERSVVQSVLRLSHELELQVVVEGVETAAQLELLRDWGCDFYQGFIRARPMPAAQFRQFAALHI